MRRRFIDNLRAYYQLAKPGIIYGNLITATAGFLLASKGSVDLGLLTSVLIGFSLVIGSACVINNVIDRKIDKKMSRTRQRAVANGQIPVLNAVGFGIILGLAGFFILAAKTNRLVLAVGLIAAFFYLVLYGAAKRRTMHGTLVGAVPGATPPLAGYLAVSSQFDTAALALFLVLFFWQLPHFYAIAMFRTREYKAANLPVISVVKASREVKTRILAYILIFTLAAASLSLLGYTSSSFLVIALLLGAAWFTYGVNNFEKYSHVIWARKMFFISLIVLSLMSLAIAADPVLSKTSWYNQPMLMVHIIVALASVAYTTLLFFAPSPNKFKATYGLVAATLASGTILVMSTQANLVHACITGLIYIGAVTVAIIFAKQRFAKQKTK